METAEIKEPETEIKIEPDRETEEGIGEEDVEPTAPAVDTTYAAVACSIDGNVKFDDSPQITPGPAPGKIKINITTLPSVVAKESQNEGEVEMLPADRSTDKEPGPVLADASREYGEDGAGEEDVDSQEPPPPGVEPVQLKPRLVGRKLSKLPPVMKGTELSGLCSIM
jgi:pre-mRNA cleavage complex 2 protein Pcf11